MRRFDTPYQVFWADEPARKRLVVGACEVCEARCDCDANVEVGVISKHGVVHHADGDTTLCGHRAASDDWWWPL